MADVFRIDYELADRSSEWSVYIAASSSDDAVIFLQKSLVPQSPLIRQINHQCRLDNISGELLKKIIQVVGIVPGDAKSVVREEVKPEIKETPSPSSGPSEKEVICPWCEKVFKTAPALKAHITRTHKDK